MKSSSIGDVLFTKTQQKVLCLLYGQTDRSFYMNQIVRIADIGKGTINRELEKMLAAGLLTIKRIGNQNHYQANEQCPVYSELKAIVTKTFGLTDTIRDALNPIDPQIEFAFVYGSIAKGDDTANSDIDLLVVSDTLAYAEIMEKLVDVEQSLGRPINPTIYSLEQIRNKLQNKNAFLTRVMEQHKLWIKGGQDDIGETRKPR